MNYISTRGAGIGERHQHRLPASMSCLECKGQDAAADRGDAGQCATRKMFTAYVAPAGHDDKRYNTTHDRVDETDVAGPVSGSHKLEVGKLQDGGDAEVRPCGRQGQRQKGYKGQGRDSPAGGNQGRIQRLVFASLDDRVPGGMQQGAEQYKNNHFERHGNPCDIREAIQCGLPELPMPSRRRSTMDLWGSILSDRHADTTRFISRV